ncbi:MAG: TIGR01212 family radical SAM protein [Candidatus Nealsonbacteria bacterium]|nr:TIGR01212 family radical SAM protein [Candidatus Nealsonbacteria bacterium]
MDLPSTILLPHGPRIPPWRAEGLLLHSRKFANARQFGCRVWKVSVDAGLGCPNRDGTVGTGGCVFCDPASFSPALRIPRQPILGQIDDQIARLGPRYGVDRFVAYFQPATNTYGPVDRLAELYNEALSHPSVVALAIGTRPDCVSEEVLDLLAGLSRRLPVSLEFGLQTIHDRTLDWINRGHHYDAFLDAVARSRQRGLAIGAHVILGLPGESHEQMMATAAELTRLRIESVKLHNLCAVRNTLLAQMVARGEVQLPQFEEYVTWVVDFLELTAPDCIIDRLHGDAPPEYLIGPDWCLNKSAVRAAVEAEFRRRGSWQGKRA